MVKDECDNELLARIGLDGFQALQEATGEVLSGAGPGIGRAAKQEIWPSLYRTLLLHGHDAAMNLLGQYTPRVQR